MSSKVLELSPVPTDDQTAIADVIYQETLAYQRTDFNAWQEFFVHDERARECFISTTAGLGLNCGWPSISAETEGDMERGTSCQMVSFGQEDLQISISGVLSEELAVIKEPR